MNYRMILYYLAATMLVVAVFMLPALLISFIFHETSAVIAFSVTIAAVTVICLPFLFRKPKKTVMRAREGYIITAIAWILVSLIGAVPLWMSKTIPNYIDALFETASGFTTTGASIMPTLDFAPKGMIYWRSFTHWLGGMGVLVFLLALTPSSSSGDSVFIMRAESPGPQVSKLVPKTRQSAQILYKIYVGMTILQIVLLLLGGMPFLDALEISFATAGTGGFSCNSAGMALYTPYMLWVITIFMILFGVNFGIYYLLIMRSFKKIKSNEEIRYYFLAILAAIAIITPKIYSIYHHSFGDALLQASFQTASIISTTGFASADFNTWPTVCKMTLLLLMILGGCAGSTGGGVKVSRTVILFKCIRLSLRKLLHPNTVTKVHMDGDTVPDATLHFIYIYFGAYSFIMLLSMLLISLDHMSLEGTITSVLTCLNNVGPGFAEVGPMSTYASLTWFSKVVLTIDMLIGRLEIFPILMLLMPANWKRSRV